ncbi:MAG: RlmE family RNA methyltransferase [Treponema sp.]|jgi:23S rRNA (uridine2552-2'-O)-methyltransferase|nr:RlmE family RNA methyltransferase [Treponema sp.]
MVDYKKPDHWQQRARKEGYPARSVYKLIEIDEKFGLFKKLRPASGTASGRSTSAELRVLDLGAAPGSWSLYALRKMAGSGFLASCDLSPLSREFDNGLFDGGNFFFIQGDITTVEIREPLFAKGPYSTIISDAAPATTGSHIVDAARSLELAETVVNYAEGALFRGGNLALKVFQGGSSAALLKRIKTLFETAKSFKPQACRGESVETYYIGLNFTGNSPH